jgi:hypothetical protein
MTNFRFDTNRYSIDETLVPLQYARNFKFYQKSNTGKITYIYSNLCSFVINVTFYYFNIKIFVF